MADTETFDKGDWGYHPLPLLKKVFQQMLLDDSRGDYTAIDELFKNVSSECLKAYLPEEV